MHPVRLYNTLNRRIEALAPVNAGKVSENDRMPPAPRLQTEPKQDLLDFRAAESATISSYGWVDRNNRIVRIPIADAMKLTLERGLPSRPQTSADAPAAAPSEPQEKK